MLNPCTQHASSFRFFPFISVDVHPLIREDDLKSSVSHVPEVTG